MIGTKVSHRQTARRTPPGAVALEAKGLTVFDATGRELVDHLDISVRHGEILGLFGLLGSGVIEATMALFGAWRGTVSGEHCGGWKGRLDRLAGRRGGTAALA